jgi:hypothetical protein
MGEKPDRSLLPGTLAHRARKANISSRMANPPESAGALSGTKICNRQNFHNVRLDNCLQKGQQYSSLSLCNRYSQM